MFAYMARYRFELATDERRRRRHAASAGFCPSHTWHYAETASDVGIAAAYAGVADRTRVMLSSLLDDAATPDELRRGAADLIPTARRCPACRTLASAERSAVTAIAAALRTQPSDRRPPRLCLVHLATVLAADPGPDGGRQVVRAFTGELARSADDLRAYVRKRDAARRDLITDDEKHAARLLLYRLAGHPVRAQSGRAR
jgi:hypothetical protein